MQSFEINKKKTIHIHKFGGASLKSAESVRNAVSIIKRHSSGKLLVVCSAMGGTTDGLEKVIGLAQGHKPFDSELSQIKEYHEKIISELLGKEHFAMKELGKALEIIKNKAITTGDFDEVYDQVIGYGEIISSSIIHHILADNQKFKLIDARKYIATDSSFREGQVNWKKTEENIQELRSVLEDHHIITQGFIGSDADGRTVTLGREGSDYSAAIFGFTLNANSVTIWKDVPGVMSADPKRSPDAIVFEELPYKEAAEMTYFGASVIHPKTIKPLANRGIPLLVKSFIDSSLPGTVIHECHVRNLPPLIVYKDNQCLISCRVTDYTFIEEQQLGIIFKALTESHNRVNVMQNSAISFSFCVDYRESKVNKLIEILSQSFEVYFNTGLTLITVKNYDTKTFNQYRGLPKVILEQSSRSTLQVLARI